MEIRISTKDSFEKRLSVTKLTRGFLIQSAISTDKSIICPADDRIAAVTEKAVIDAMNAEHEKAITAVKEWMKEHRA